MSESFSKRNNRRLSFYHALDSRHGEPVVSENLGKALSSLHTGQTSQLMQCLPLVEGMPVVFTHNYDVSGGVVNGTEGILKSVSYEVGDDGKRYATSCVVTCSSVTCDALPGLFEKEVVALREKMTFKLRNPHTRKVVSIQRQQLPIQPAFAMTDYKSQGRTMQKIIIDLQSTHSRQSAYVMLSRVKNFSGLLILRPFQPKKLTTEFDQDLKKELRRLSHLQTSTVTRQRETGRDDTPAVLRSSTTATSGTSSRDNTGLSSVSTKVEGPIRHAKRLGSDSASQGPPAKRLRPAVMFAI